VGQGLSGGEQVVVGSLASPVRGTKLKVTEIPVRKPDSVEELNATTNTPETLTETLVEGGKNLEKPTIAAEELASPKEVNKKPEAKIKAVESWPKKGWYIQVAALRQQMRAVSIASQLEQQEYSVIVKEATVRGTRYHRVLVGPFIRTGELAAVKAKLVELKLSGSPPFIRPAG
jgi:cell division septation protein DedD